MEEVRREDSDVPLRLEFVRDTEDDDYVTQVLYLRPSSLMDRHFRLLDRANNLDSFQRVKEGFS